MPTTSPGQLSRQDLSGSGVNVAKVLAGLTGQSVDDKFGENSPGRRTATGLAGPGPTDNALAWFALWGISQFPLAMRINDTAETSGDFSYGRKEWFHVSMWQEAWRPARLRSVLASQELRTFAASGLTEATDVSDLEVSKARAWLRARRVEGAVRFEILKFGSDNAPVCFLRADPPARPVAVAADRHDELALFRRAAGQRPAHAHRNRLVSAGDPTAF